MATQPVGHYERVRALAASARLLAIGGVRPGAASQVVFYDHVAEKPERTIDLPSHVLGLAHGEEVFVAACADGKLRVLSEKDGKVVREIAAHHGAANAVAVHEDLVASAGADGALRVFSLMDGKRQHEWALSSRPLRAVAIESTGEAFGAAGDDGVVRVVWPARKEDAQRSMTGHDGGVMSLAFTPSDGRIVSGGEDGTVRIWYLAGDVEADVRGKDDSGHVGGVTALLFTPAKNPDDFGDRLVSAGMDGKLHVWRMSERRKPRTLEASEPIYAVAFAPRSGRGSLGSLVAAGDSRFIYGYGYDDQNAPTDKTFRWTHGFTVLEALLAAPAKATRESTVKTLAALDEPEALELALKALAQDRDADVRALAASELAAHGRRDARRALRERLDDDHASVRAAALEALRKFEPETPLTPLRAALESKFPDMRVAALRLLVPVFATSPLASGLIAGALNDQDASVRRAAVFALVAIHPAASPEPLRVAFERGTPDVRALTLVLGAAARLGKSQVFAPLVGKGLDDADADVRRVAFVVTVLAQPALLAWLEAKDEAFGRALGDVLRRVHEATSGAGGAAGEPSADALAVAKKKIADSVAAPSSLSDEQREPLLAALACRTADTSLRGARGLALLGDMRALGALLTISRDPDPGLRRDAAQALAALDDPRAMRRLVWMLNDPDPQVRDAAFVCVTKLQPDALGLAQSALHGSEEDVRVRGLDVLVKQGKQDKARAEALLGDSLEDESAKVRGEAFRTLWAWHSADPLAVLDRALLGRFPDLRARAVTELDGFATKKDDKLAAPALERLVKTIGDRDAAVAKSAYDAVLKIKGKDDADTHLAAMASTHAALRVEGAKDAKKAPVDKVRSALSKLLEDTDALVRTTAIETLDKLLPQEAGPLLIGLQSSHLDLRVRAAELLAVRHDEHLVDPMCALIADKELLARNPAVMVPLRQRAATALASLGSPKLLKYFATQLIKDEDGMLREQAARGVSNASRRGEEGYLLDLMGHADVAVRSWAGEGLARLGDVRALPVLTGTLRHEHPPIRVGAVLSFAALGPEGYGGMLQGLEDPSRDVQRIVLSIILARDLRAFRQGEAPDLLTSALSSQRPEVRFAAARALELRIEPDRYMEHLVSVLMPDRPERAADMEKWPSEELIARMMVALAEALAGDRPEQRYAAAQALRLRDSPIEYFREVQRATALRSATSPWVPETTPRAPNAPAEPRKSPLGLLRRLFTSSAAEEKEPAPAAPSVSTEEQRRIRLLAFGAYVGLLRQATADDEGHRVRRDAIDRIVELTTAGHITLASAMPALARALDDPHHLVRKAAFSALQKVYGDDKETPLALALASSAADVVRAALDELAERGDAGKARIRAALDSNVPEARKYAFELLEKLSPKGSAEPLLAALESQHTDVRIGVLERLATSQDPRVAAALIKALESDHDDLRLRAAELLAARKDDRAVDVLSAALRSEDEAMAGRARAALAKLGSPAAVRALGARFDEQLPDAARLAIVLALGASKAPAALDVLVTRFADEVEAVRNAAIAACVDILGPRADAKLERGARVPKPRDSKLAMKVFEAAAHAKAVEVRLLAARELDLVDDAAADGLLIGLFADRDSGVRTAAVASYAKRVEKKGSKQEPLEEVMKAGARDTLLPAAEGLAQKGVAASFRALLLVARAGEAGERERALLALGTLGDKRALSELQVIAQGGTEEAPAEPSMQAAALEALGRLFSKLDEDAREEVRDRIESSVGTKTEELALAALRGLRWIGGDRSRSRIEGALGSDSTSAERRVAAECLGEMGDVAAEIPLGRALSDDDEDVRWAARDALGKLFPNERTRIEFLAVVSEQPDIAGPAAAFLADEGDATLLLTKLGALQDDDLRQRIRFGLVRRREVPAADLVKLLSAQAVTARSDAAWLIGVRAQSVSDADRATLSKALAGALHKAGEAYEAAKKKGDDSAESDEREAWVRAMWATRLIGGDVAKSEGKRVAVAKDVPEAVRVQAVLAAGSDSALKPLLNAPDNDVRAAAAASFQGGDPLALRTTPFDPVLLGRVIKALPKGALASSDGRRVYLASALRAGSIDELIEVAKHGKGQDRMDAIGALGRAGEKAAEAALRALATNKSEPEDVRKAAYRSMRRWARIDAARRRKEASS